MRLIKLKAMYSFVESFTFQFLDAIICDSCFKSVSNVFFLPIYIFFAHRIYSAIRYQTYILHIFGMISIDIIGIFS